MSSCEAITFQGAPAIRLHSPQAGSATILLHGGQVVSWLDPAGQERLYLSPLSPLDGGQAVRGGVPVIFPQFSGRGPLVRHGFARTQAWRWLPHPESASEQPTATLVLTASEETLALWPFAFRCELQVTLTPWQLDLRFTASNTGDQAWAFCAALHTYLAAGPLGAMTLQGLEKLTYEDSLLAGAVKQAPDAALPIEHAIDRIYFNTQKPLRLAGPLGQLTLVHGGWPDTVVWNPGPEGALKISDLPDTDHDRFLCIEAALIGEPQRLLPGEQWSGTQILRAEPKA
jgi:glucose-6-phosphate 1-epimerase